MQHLNLKKIYVPEIKGVQYPVGQNMDFNVPEIKGVQYPVGQNMDFNVPEIKKLIRAFVAIPEFKRKGVYIIGTGSSGMIIATMFSAYMRRENKIIAIRKEDEYSHHDNRNIWMGNSSWVTLIVDDFISTGSTMNRIYDELLHNVHDFKGRVDCVATVGYDRSSLLKFEPAVRLSMGEG